MIKAPKTLTGETPTASGGLRPAGEVSFGLEPAEFDALVERLCSCSTLRIDSDRLPRRRHCRPSSRLLWCRLGERAAGAFGVVETKFG
jgi:hypothetical protein